MNAINPKFLGLDAFAVGSEVIVESVDASALTLPLMEAGIIPGTTLRILRRAPFGCPLEISIGSSRFAIRCEDAQAIRARVS